MSFDVKTTAKAEDTANFIVLSILNQLKKGKQVLFFVTGGSSIAVGVKTSELLRNYPQQNLTQNLTIMLTDERYGSPDHADSNWRQLIENGFKLREARLVPILTGDDYVVTIKNFDVNLRREFITADYKIGLFGIGADGHTAGILPDSEAVYSQDLACGYDTPTFYRITMTPKAIEKLDQAVVFATGEIKWEALQNLEKDIEVLKQPSQILKKVPSLTIFTDYKNLQ